MAAATFTVSQATDLARYFLGPAWEARYEHNVCCLYESGQFRHWASSWRTVFRAAGASLPARPRYACVGRRVMFGAEAVATAVSNSMAARIAGALNEYQPDRRGK